MIDIGESVIAIKDETFNKIYIYGFGTVIDIIRIDDEIIYEVELEDNGYIIEVYSVVATCDWVDYVDERDAKVIRVKYEC